MLLAFAAENYFENHRLVNNNGWLEMRTVMKQTDPEESGDTITNLNLVSLENLMFSHEKMEISELSFSDSTGVGGFTVKAIQYTAYFVLNDEEIHVLMFYFPKENTTEFHLRKGDKALISYERKDSVGENYFRYRKVSISQSEYKLILQCLDADPPPTRREEENTIDDEPRFYTDLGFRLT